MLRQRFIALAMILASTASAAAKDIALISNKTNHLPPIALQDLVKICKGQLNRWPDGKAVSFVMRDPASPDMKLVLSKVYEMSSEEVAAVISTANHSRINHPAIVVVDSDEALVKKVETTPGAVGLVDVYSITGGVTVVKIGGKLPLEPGYLLHGN